MMIIVGNNGYEAHVTIKTIIVPYGGLDHELAAMDMAFRLGQRFRAHVEVWHIVSNFIDVFESYAAFTPISECEQAHALAIAKEVRESEKKARMKFLEVVKKYQPKGKSNGADGPSFSFHSATGLLEDVLGARGRTADLIVMCRPHRESDRFFSEMVTAIMRSSQRPLLLLPKGMKADDLGGDTLVAWNGSAEAGKAIQFALPLLNGKAWIVSNQPKGRSEKPVPGAEDLQAYLQRHNVNAEICLYNVKNGDAASVIADQATKRKASLIVMGAYSHSRLREMIFGGVTDIMLRDAKLPLLLAG